MFTPLPNNRSQELVFSTEEVVKINNTYYSFQENINVKKLKESNLCILRNNCESIRNNKTELIVIK